MVRPYLSIRPLDHSTNVLFAKWYMERNTRSRPTRCQKLASSTMRRHTER